tara:strand:+ start:13 stop:453 length:441 start_codon:yes stop_codon:yes gene_type:complete
MKIEIDIDIESIVREALKKKQSEDIIPVETTTNSRSKWEYGRRNGRRRTTEEMALHDLEREKGRRLTPEEKGEAKALVEIDETTENIIKEKVIKKAHIDKIVAEGTAAASKELAEEEHEEHELMHKEVQEATIPKTEKLDTNSLFS